MNYSMNAVPNVEFEVNSLYAVFQQITDKRKARGKRYALATILTLSVLAKLGGEDAPEGMAHWVAHRAEQLSAWLGLKRTTMPHAVTYRRVLGQAIEMAEVEEVIGAFFATCQQENGQLAIDGKTLRGTIEAGQTRGVHLLAVYDVDAGVVLNQVQVGMKTNEISAAPALLAAVQVSGQVVTGDAMFTQRALSSQIVEAGGHYLWTVKDNQPTLRAAIARLFGPEQVPVGSAPLRTDFQSVVTTAKTHGRLEKYTLTTSALLNPTTDWPALGQVFQLTRDVRFLKSGKVTHEVVYAITSLSPTAASPSRLLTLHRQHWAIENKLHYCRDVTFHEDACHLASAHAAHAIALLNNLVIGLLHRHGFTAIAAARRRFAALPAQALVLLLRALP